MMSVWRVTVRDQPLCVIARFARRLDVRLPASESRLSTCSMGVEPRDNINAHHDSMGSNVNKFAGKCT